MKTIASIFLGLSLFLASAARASAAGSSATSVPVPVVVAPAGGTAAAAAPLLDASALDTLAGPVALYPDTLLAIILPASTNPADIVLAARYLENGGDAAQIDNQPWDASVRALAHYPDVLRWMDENLAWTQQLGATFIAQPEDVMVAVQRLRVRAQSVGNLSSNEQLTVVNEGAYIRIIPTRTEVVYVPYYDPAVVYVSRVRYYYGPAWPCGPWLSYDCNWIVRGIWIGVWSPVWFLRPAWRHAPPPRVVHRHTWRPNPHRPPPPRPPGPILHPRPPRGNPDWAHANPPPRRPRPPNYQRPADQRPPHPPGRDPGSRPPPSLPRPVADPPAHRQSSETAGRAATTQSNRHTPPRPNRAAPVAAANQANTTAGRQRDNIRQPATVTPGGRAANPPATRTAPPPRPQQTARPSRQQPSAQPAQPAPPQQTRPSPPPSRTQPRENVSNRSSEKQASATSPRSSSSRDSSRQQTRPGRS